MLVHQLPPRPSNLRVTTWRRLQQLGAVLLRNSVYVLPNTPEAREDMEWLRSEITASRGQASVVVADVVDSYTDDELVRQFRSAREREYAALIAEVQGQTRTISKGPRSRSGAPAQRGPRVFRDRLERLRAIDYFVAPNADHAVAAVVALENAIIPSPTVVEARLLDVKAFRARTWVTRSRPGIDRIASAWFIRRHVDKAARFAFVTPSARPRKGQVPFDMYEVDFGHHGADCTFETLMRRFGVNDPATRRIAEIVHDLDLKESRFGRPECVAVSHLVDGLRRSFDHDRALLEQGMVMVEALYRSFTGPGEPKGKAGARKRRAKA